MVQEFLYLNLNINDRLTTYAIHHKVTISNARLIDLLLYMSLNSERRTMK